MSKVLLGAVFLFVSWIDRLKHTVTLKEGFKLIVEFIWEVPKIRGTYCWGPYNTDPTILGCYIGVPYFRKPPY